MKQIWSFTLTLCAALLGLRPAAAETTYWLPKIESTPMHVTYTYNVQLPAYLVDWIQNVPKPGSGETVQKAVDGKKLTFVRRHVVWDTGGSCPEKTGQIRFDARGGAMDGTWKSSPELKAATDVIQSLNASARASEGPWKGASILALKWDGAGPPGVTFREGNPNIPFSLVKDGFGQFAGPPQAIGAYAGDKLAVAWKEVGGKKVKVAHYSGGPSSPCLWVKEYVLSEKGQELDTNLAGFTSDTTGENVFLMIARNEDMRTTPGWQLRSQVLRLLKINIGKAQAPDYAPEWNVELNSDGYAEEHPNGAPGDTKPTKKFSPIYSPMVSGTAGIAFGNGRVGIICSSFSTPIDGQQRHQCAFRLSVNVADGSVAARTKWYSFRHSFNQRVMYDGADFVFMDLADSDKSPHMLPGPGINLCKISGTADDHPKVGFSGVDWYCYARNGLMNDTHTWLGDIQPGGSGYTVLFSSLRDSTAKAATMPRDLALVHVVKDFQDQPRNVESAKIVVGSNLVDTKKGNPEATGDQNFGSSYGDKRPMGNTGIVWLTSGKDTTVVKPKLFKLTGQDRYLAVWEKWEVSTAGGSALSAMQSYRETCAMTFDAYGANKSQETSLGIARMDDRSELFAIGAKVAWLVRMPEGVVLYELDPANPAPPTATLLSAVPGKSGTDSGAAPMAMITPGAGDATLPLSANHEVVQGKKYRSPSGGHYLLFQPDGNLAVYTSTNQHVWDFSKVAPRWKEAKSVRMGVDGNLGASDGAGKYVWSALHKDPDPTATLTISPSGALQLVSGKSGQLLWSSAPTEAREWKIVQTLDHADGATCLAWSPDAQKIATGEATGTVHIWNGMTGAKIHALSGHTHHVAGVKWSPDGSKLASCSTDKTVRIWDAASGKSLHEFTGHTGRVDEIAWAPDGSKLLSSSPVDNTMRIWDATNGASLLTITLTNGTPESCVAWSPDGSRIAAGTNDKKIEIFDSKTGAALQALAMEGTPISVTWSPDGTKIATGGFDRHVRVWEVAGGKLLHAITWGKDDIRGSVAWSPDGSKLATASREGAFGHTSPETAVKVVDAANGAVLHTLAAYVGLTSTVEWSPDGSKLTCGTGNATLPIWDAVTGAKLASLPCPAGYPQPKWSKDGTRIAVLAGLKVLVVSQ